MITAQSRFFVSRFNYQVLAAAAVQVVVPAVIFCLTCDVLLQLNVRMLKAGLRLARAVAELGYRALYALLVSTS